MNGGGGAVKNTTIRHTAGGRYPVLQSKTCVIMQHYASWHSQLDPGLRRDDDLNCTLHFKKTPDGVFLLFGGLYNREPVWNNNTVFLGFNQ